MYLSTSFLGQSINTLTSLREQVHTTRGVGSDDPINGSNPMDGAKVVPSATVGGRVSASTSSVLGEDEGTCERNAVSVFHVPIPRN